MYVSCETINNDTKNMYDRNKFRNSLYNGASMYGVNLDDNTLSLFETYYDILSDWNTRINLVSKRDINRFVEYHLLDSLKISSCFDMLKIKNILDFGSGAGLPGIPLTLAFPHLKTVLVDSRKNRSIFLENVIKSIPDLEAKVICSRIENLPDQLNECFDVVITRGTLKLKKFFLFSCRFIRRGGSLISIKGNNIKNEIIDLNNIFDLNSFHIKQTEPKDVFSVRKGKIIIITRN